MYEYSTSLQLHITRTEIAEFIWNIVETHSMYCVVDTSRSFSFVEVTSREQFVNLMKCGNSLVVYLKFEKIETDCIRTKEFLEKNENLLEFSVGKQSQEELFESVFSCQTNDEEFIKFARKVRNKLKKQTNSKAQIYIKYTAQTHPINHYHSKGAKEMFKHGTIMRPVAGGNTFEFPF